MRKQSSTRGGNRGCVPLFWVYPGCGTVFELSPTGKGQWTKQTLEVFSSGADGGNPVSGLIIDAAGNLFGRRRLLRLVKKRQLA
jgi:hypothetical protein